MFIIRFIIYSFFFYLVFKAVKYLTGIFKSIDVEKKPKVHKNPNTHLDIKKDDVIDADFEEIENNKKDK